LTIKDIGSQIGFHAEAKRISNEVSTLTGELQEFQIKERLMQLFKGIENLRLQMNCWIQTNLQADLIKAAELWASTEPSLKEKIAEALTTLRGDTHALKTEIDSFYTDSSAPQADTKKLALWKEQLATIKDKFMDFKYARGIQTGLAKLLDLLESIKQRVETTEYMIKLVSNANFKWTDDEALVITLEAKDMNKKTEGFLTFTNKRIIYESATTKKTERQLLLERPVDSVAKITKGKMGIFKPEGIYVEFKQPSDLKLKLAMKWGGDADLAIQHFNMISSGQINDELKSGINFTMRERYKELATSYFPGDSFCFGRCKTCGKMVSPPIKKWTMDGWLTMGIFDCPTCKKPFRETLEKKRIKT
jgi:hypothetical protein